MNKMDEIIIVVPRKDLFEEERLAFQGIDSTEEAKRSLLKNIEMHYTLLKRGEAEEDDNYKQPIPYIVIRKNDKVFLYERLKGGGESRLHSKLSLGVGGHMNPIKGSNSFQKLLTSNSLRELMEELEFSLNYVDQFNSRFEIIGFINDDSNDVGKVHVGLLVVLDIADDIEVGVKEEDQLLGKWVSIEDLKDKKVYDRLENWSKIVADIIK
ncbi:hypothetical protein JR311_20210 (plasmid) [Bacillus velezensis]|uniref:hypothetical protein n=1 Tax=Bacillus velezensis TaxID=492670 RepID=UPI001958DDAB|nr:hypothetical protein [Bacillus velezensis]QRV11351.1 hypothetical protein JR311_20210 [Bacillus velezensis]